MGCAKNTYFIKNLMNTITQIEFIKTEMQQQITYFTPPR